MQLAPATPRGLESVDVTFSTWALQQAYTPANTSLPATGPDGWSHPITLNVYSATSGANPTVGSLLGSVTQDVRIPWRPAADPTCPTATAWRQASTGSCFNGYAFTRTFDFSGLTTPVTLADQVIVTVALRHADLRSRAPSASMARTTR